MFLKNKKIKGNKWSFNQQQNKVKDMPEILSFGYIGYTFLLDVLFFLFNTPISKILIAYKFDKDIFQISCRNLRKKKNFFFG